MEHKTVSSIKNNIIENSHIGKQMADICLSIIDHVSIGSKTRTHLTFKDLHNLNPNVDEDVFYDAVFYLTRVNVNVLVQQFEALHPRNGFVAVPNRKEIIEDMRNDELSNPFTGEELSEEEFGKQVITYFSVSPEFMRLSNA